MSGTREGAQQMRQAMIEALGSEEAWLAWMRNNGKVGGSAKVPKGFAVNKEAAIAGGRKGGKISRRIANPGSDVAVKKGCSCPVMDNHHGHGFPGENGPQFWTSRDCPLHGFKEENGKLKDS